LPLDLTQEEKDILCTIWAGWDVEDLDDAQKLIVQALARKGLIRQIWAMTPKGNAAIARAEAFGEDVL